MIKKGNSNKRNVDDAIRVHLIRKGNESFSTGQIADAEKIFVTVDYKGGLVRLGDYYLEKNDLYKSVEMYFKSENPSKIDAFCAQAAKVIQKMLNDDKKEVFDKIIIENKLKG